MFSIGRSQLPFVVLVQGPCSRRLLTCPASSRALPLCATFIGSASGFSSSSTRRVFPRRARRPGVFDEAVQQFEQERAHKRATETRNYAEEQTAERMREEEEYSQVEFSFPEPKSAGPVDVFEHLKVPKVHNLYRPEFKDRVRVQVHSGRGGHGCVSFGKEANKPRAPPDGGNGGDGGDVILRVGAVRSLGGVTSHHFRATNGKNGRSRRRNGRRGVDAVITVPPGTVVKLLEENADVDEWEFAANDQGGGDDGGKEPEESLEELLRSESLEWQVTQDQIDDIDPAKFEESLMDLLQENSALESRSVSGEPNKKQRDRQEKATFLVDMMEEGQEFVLAKGGRGGRGNAGYHWRRSVDRSIESPFRVVTQGREGESMKLELEMKSIADIGLVGYPNAGKSTLLRSISSARPKVAPYPFTTLHPRLGMLDDEYRNQISVADLPGLIEGAHENKGLGHAFLRHIERTKVLCFVLDMAYVDKHDPVEVLETLVAELELYEPHLTTTRDSVIVGNKMDLGKRAGKKWKELRRMFEERSGVFARIRSTGLFAVSAKSGQGTETLVKHLHQLLHQ